MASLVGTIGGVLIMIVIMAVPLIAIITNHQLKMKKLEIDKMRPQNDISMDEINILAESIQRLKVENDTLKAEYLKLAERLNTIEQAHN